MKKIRFAACFAVLLLLFSACSGTGGTYVYDTENHTHVYGAWYTVTQVTCLAEGEHICYCKICGTAFSEPVPVATDVAARVHDFEDTVVAPTESVAGYTRRVCRLCQYVVERANEIPALFCLALPETDLIVYPGVSAQLAFDTGRSPETHQNPVDAAQNTGQTVNVTPALYLAAALVGAEAVNAGELSGSDTVTITAELLAGRDGGKYREGVTVSVFSLIEACLSEQNEVALAALSSLLAGNDALFVERLNARMAVLGVRKTAFSAITGGVGTTTLYDSAILLWRVLEVNDLATRMDLGFSVNGKKCLAFFEVDSFRLVAVENGDTFYITAIC